MDLPATIRMRSTQPIPLVGRRGETYIRQNDEHGLGVALLTTRAHWSAPFVDAWSHIGLPRRTFHSYEELRQAVAAVRDEVLAAELAYYPHVSRHLQHAPRPDAICSVCGPAAENTGPCTTAAFIAMTWRPEDDRYVQLCAEHQGLLDKPRALVQAMNDAAKPATTKDQAP